MMPSQQLTLLITLLSLIFHCTLPLGVPSSASRRNFLIATSSSSASALLITNPSPTLAAPEINKGALEMYNKAINLQATGNIAASLPLLARVTDMEPTFPYGWSSLADVQVALGDVVSAQKGYREAIRLCSASESCKVRPQTPFTQTSSRHRSLHGSTTTTV